MSELLIEIYSEEIPSRMQIKAASDTKKIFSEFLTKQNIKFKEEDLQTFITPRRLALYVKNIDEKQVSPAINKIGPKVDAPEAAINGFLKSVGVADVSKLEKITRDNGEYYSFKQNESYANTIQILEKNLDAVLSKINGSWAKTMDLIDEEKSSNWVRPIRNILAIFDGKVLNFQFANLKTNNQTFGHLLYGKNSLQIVDFSDYVKKLEENFVILDWHKRREIIVKEIAKIDANLVEKNSRLIDEITGLVEYPNVLIGKIDNEFKDLPEEILELVIKLHQKAIVIKSEELKFIFVANLKTDEKSTVKIISDNEKVVRARLSDAKFYMEEDLKIPFSQRIEQLKNITFHEKLGSLYNKSTRLDILNKFISLWVPNVPMSVVERLADFAKNDLSTKTVAELPELQGIVGSYYIKKQDLPSDVADKISLALAEQYLPVGLDSKLPKSELGMVLAIADKMDNIAGLFLAGEKPTASKDPYALRRAAIGIIKISLENRICLPIRIVVDRALSNFPTKVLKEIYPQESGFEIKKVKHDLSIEITNFFIERAKIYIKEQYNLRADIINQVFVEVLQKKKTRSVIDLVEILDKINFVSKFIADEKNVKIIELYKRASNIVAIESKKDKKQYDGKVSIIYLKEKEEKILYKKIKQIKGSIKKLLKRHDYAGAMILLSELENPIKNFFECVEVNSANSNWRYNRLTMLSKTRYLFNKVFNFSEIN